MEEMRSLSRAGAKPAWYGTGVKVIHGKDTCSTIATATSKQEVLPTISMEMATLMCYMAGAGRQMKYGGGKTPFRNLILKKSGKSIRSKIPERSSTTIRLLVILTVTVSRNSCSGISRQEKCCWGIFRKTQRKKMHGNLKRYGRGTLNLNTKD